MEFAGGSRGLVRPGGSAASAVEGVPADGPAHRFAEVLPRIVSGAEEHVCLDCATALEPWEGQPAPRLYGFTARDVAAALAMVAGGASYRETAEAIRIRAGRALSTEPGRSPSKVTGEQSGREGQGAATGKPTPPADLGLGRGVQAHHLVRAADDVAGCGGHRRDGVPVRPRRQAPRRQGILGPRSDGCATPTTPPSGPTWPRSRPSGTPTSRRGRRSWAAWTAARAGSSAMADIRCQQRPRSGPTSTSSSGDPDSACGGHLPTTPPAPPGSLATPHRINS